MNRRHFMKALTAASASVLLAQRVSVPLEAALPNAKIRRIRYNLSPNPPIFDQSTGIVTVETDQGIVSVGEGGTKETIKQAGALLIGENPFRIAHLWQLMYRGYFYPAGREKLHAIGALDLALWDIKGEALGLPVHELLGGLTRDYIHCYATAFPSQGSMRETARACIEAGFRAYRTAVADPEPNQPFDAQRLIRKTYADCQQIREGVGPEGAWAIDYHTRLDPPEAVRLSQDLENLEPYFLEDLVRSEPLASIESSGSRSRCPLPLESNLEPNERSMN
jgi:galactonate dehydratase